MRFLKALKVTLGGVLAAGSIVCTSVTGFCTNYTDMDEYIQETNKQWEAIGYTNDNGGSQPQSSGGKNFTSMEEYIQKHREEAAKAGYESTSDLSDWGITSPSNMDTPNKGQNQVIACEHSYSSKVTRDATCADLGEVTYTCSKCGATYTEPIPATGEHDYVAEVTKDATCTENGETTYTCSVCGDSYTEEVATTGHKYGSSVAEAATCTTDGTMVYKCKVCDGAYTEVLPALGHTESEPMVTKEAGLFTEGEQITKCTVCDEILSAEAIPSRYPVSILYFGIAAVFLIAICSLALVKKRTRSK